MWGKWSRVGHRGETMDHRHVLPEPTSTRSTRRTGSRCRRSSATGSAATSSSPRDRPTVDVYPRQSWESSVERITGLDSLNREAREMKRFVFAGATVAEVDKQGRGARAARSRAPCGPRQGRRGRRGSRPHRDLGSPGVGGSRQRDRRERRRCCRTCSGQTRLITSRFSRRRCASSSTSSRERRSSMRPSVPAATRACWAARSPGKREARRDRPRPHGAAVLRPREGRRRAGVQTRFLRGDYGVVLSSARRQRRARGRGAARPRPLSSMQVDRPERGFSYATDAPLDMRMDPSEEPSAADVLAT